MVGMAMEKLLGSRIALLMPSKQRSRGQLESRSLEELAAYARSSARVYSRVSA